MKFTLFPITIPLWNSLPAKVVEIKTTQFTTAQVQLAEHLMYIAPSSANAAILRSGQVCFNRGGGGSHRRPLSHFYVVYK